MYHICGNSIVRELFLHCLEKNGFTTTTAKFDNQIVVKSAGEKLVVYDYDGDYALTSFCTKERRNFMYVRGVYHTDYHYNDYIVSRGGGFWAFQRLFKLESACDITSRDLDSFGEEAKLVSGKEFGKTMTIEVISEDVSYVLTRVALDKAKNVAYYTMIATSASASDLCCPMLPYQVVDCFDAKAVILECTPAWAHESNKVELNSPIFTQHPRTLVVRDIKLAMDIIWESNKDRVLKDITQATQVESILSDDIETAITGAALRYTIETHLGISVSGYTNLPIVYTNFVFLLEAVLTKHLPREFFNNRDARDELWYRAGHPNLLKLTLDSYTTALFSKLIVDNCKETAKKIGELIYYPDLEEDFDTTILAVAKVLGDIQHANEVPPIDEMVEEIERMLANDDKAKLIEFCEQLGVDSRIGKSYYRNNTYRKAFVFPITFNEDAETYTRGSPATDIIISYDDSPGRIGISSALLRGKNPTSPCVVKTYSDGMELAFCIIFNQPWCIERFGHIAPTFVGVRQQTAYNYPGFVNQRHGVDFQNVIDRISDDIKSRQYIYKILIEVAYKVKTLNNAGWVHSDLKSHNVVVSMMANGDPDVRLLDFEGVKQGNAYRDAKTGVRLVHHSTFHLVTPMIRNFGIVNGLDDLYKTDLWALLHMWVCASFKMLLSISKIKFETSVMMLRVATAFVNALSLSPGTAARVLWNFHFFVSENNCMSYTRICAALDDDLRLEKNMVMAIENANQDLEELIMQIRHHPRSNETITPGQTRIVYNSECFDNVDDPTEYTTTPDSEYTKSQYVTSTQGQTKLEQQEEEIESVFVKQVRLALPQGIKKVNLQMYVYELLG